MEAMPLTCLAVCGRMCIADRQVKVTDAGPAVRCEVLAQKGLRSRRFVAVTDCSQEPASAAGVLANVYTYMNVQRRQPYQSLDDLHRGCTCTSHPSWSAVLYVMLQAVRSEAEVAAASS